jgi:hypothetical protein
MQGLLNDLKKFKNDKICSSRTVRTVHDNTVLQPSGCVLDKLASAF